MSEIKVSVIITTYKRSHMIQRAIDSVLNQTYSNIEVIVVDDNDADNQFRRDTEALMSTYSNNEKVVYIQHEKNMNGAVARNTGIKASKGDIVCFLDDDDWYELNKIEKQIDYIQKNPQFKAVYCGWDRSNEKVVPTKEGNLAFEILSGSILIYTNTIMIWKDAALACGGWDEELKRNQEAGFLLRFFATGFKIGVVSEVLVKFDVSDRSNALNAKKNEEQFEILLDKYITILKNMDGNFSKAYKTIYCRRYKGVMLAYLKEKCIKDSIRVYLKMLKFAPIGFNRELLKYLYLKLFKLSLYDM